MGKNTQIKARNAGSEIHLSHSQVDTPLLDVKSLEHLQQFRPDIVDFVVEQTKKEAEHRRKQDSRMINYTFIERIGALLLGTLIGAGSITGAIYAAMQGFETLATAIATVGLGSLAVAFLRRDKK
ncbi:hypothetical protein E4T80_10020 [Muribacter muris]|uniref:DUF2335 domain-containing protein n=1 Tax=Muribacter muris TaxID=67855 RepID=A0A4Y9JVT4_9PAST|nr:hypothetical protein [Muribacter muris]MBF0785796.1 hypothetical protein [Muribacter muris]MBF0828232.1 hypothetical protein [Muribacter muris]TFV08617.1 hypothetical protein E4T80_10020 [Muribacter muris]